MLPILLLILHLTCGPAFPDDPDDESKGAFIAFTLWGVFLTVLPFGCTLGIFLKSRFQLRVAEWYAELDQFLTHLDRVLAVWDRTKGAYQLGAMEKALGADKATLVAVGMQVAAGAIGATRVNALDVVRAMTKKNGGMV